MDLPEAQPDRLLLLASSGDGDAVSALLARYQGPLAAYIRRRRGRQLAQRESESDLAQSVCRELLEDVAGGGLQFRGEAEFRRWLYRAALNKLRMRGRYWHAERRAARLEATASGSGPAVSETPSRVVDLQEQRARLRAAVQRLPQEQRQVVELARFEGLAHREIGARLGISEGHSRVLLARAMAELARQVAGL